MKKKIQRARKLRLSRQTIRNLDALHLVQGRDQEGPTHMNNTCGDCTQAIGCGCETGQCF